MCTAARRRRLHLEGRGSSIAGTDEDGDRARSKAETVAGNDVRDSETRSRARTYIEPRRNSWTAIFTSKLDSEFLDETFQAELEDLVERLQAKERRLDEINRRLSELHDPPPDPPGPLPEAT